MQSQVKLNRVSEKVPEGRGGFGAEPGHVQQGSREGAGEGLAGGERRGGFGAEPGQVLGQVLQSTRVPEKVRRRSGRLWCRARSGSTGFRRRFPEKKVCKALVQSQRRLNRVPEKVPEKVLGGFGAEPGQVQQGSRRRRSGRLWCRASAGSTEFRRRFQRRFWEACVQSHGSSSGRMFLEKVWEALVQSQVRFTRFPEKVPEKLPGGFGGSGSTRFWRRFRRRSGGTSSLLHGYFFPLWCRARSGSTVSQRLASQHASGDCVKIKRCGCWGYHRSLFSFWRRDIWNMDVIPEP